MSGRRVQPAFQHDQLCSQVLAGDYFGYDENYEDDVDVDGDDGDNGDDSDDDGDHGNLLDSIR